MNDHPNGEKLLLRIEEAARRCSIGRSKAYELVQSGEWPTVHIGRSVRIPAVALQEWVDRQLEAVTASTASVRSAQRVQR